MIETVGIEGVIETVIGNLRRGIETEGGVEKEKGTGIEIEMVIETDIGIKDDEAILLIKCFVKRKTFMVRKKIKNILNLFIFINFYKTVMVTFINNLTEKILH